ncbi:hypothetical protein [uncultured Sphingomonas sp.]|uniref:hypothetical protein n=1 Tax=uncultured Sphingomonas sp. TaxID=158754 RepID=UPI0025E6189A|nr:hypothetical protein [uncultured Sphingomonas sp.]
MKHVALLASLTAMACLAPGVVQAQATDQPLYPSGQTDEPVRATADQRGTGEIVVTARRREERPQDVPVVIFAVSGDALQSCAMRR